MLSPTRSRRTFTLVALAALCLTGSAARLLQSESAVEEPRTFHLASAASTVTALPPIGQRVAQEPLAAPPELSGRLEQARQFSDAFASVAAAVTPTVVRIQTERSVATIGGQRMDRLREMFDQLPEDHPDPHLYPQVGGGTGFLVNGDGLILTNNHVIAGADRITVTLSDKRAYDATVVGADPTTDIALIVIDQGGLPAARLGDSDELQVGEWVLAVGNPGFEQSSTLDFTVTSGIVSAKGRPLDIIRQELSSNGNPAAAYAIEDFIQTDAAINPGNSGGPLIDLNGRVIGINTAIASRSGFNQGYGFAVPINVARRVMRDLLEHGRVRRPLLGISIQNVTPEDAEVYGLPRIMGVLVEDFASGHSPAQRAGIRRHDVIIAVDGEPVERLGQFQRLVADHAPGDVVQVDLVRYGESLRLPVRLKEAEFDAPRVVRTAAEPQPRPGLGLEMVELTGALAREWSFREAGGALITGVEPGSAAMRKGLERGLVVREINRQPVGSADQAQRILRSLPSGAVASLLLALPGGSTTIRNVRVP